MAPRIPAPGGSPPFCSPQPPLPFLIFLPSKHWKPYSSAVPPLPHPHLPPDDFIQAQNSESHLYAKDSEVWTASLNLTLNSRIINKCLLFVIWAIIVSQMWHFQKRFPPKPALPPVLNSTVTLPSVSCPSHLSFSYSPCWTKKNVISSTFKAQLKSPSSTSIPAILGTKVPSSFTSKLEY